MLRRSPLALKQPPLGDKGRQRCRDRAAIGKGLVLRRFSFSRSVTYLRSLELFLGEVLDLRIGSCDVAGSRPRELLPSSPHSPSCSTSSGPGPRASSAAAGMTGRDAVGQGQGVRDGQQVRAHESRCSGAPLLTRERIARERERDHDAPHVIR